MDGDTGWQEECGYEEPAIRQEEFWFYSTIRDAGELIRVHGAKDFIAELDDKAREALVDALQKGNNK